MFDGGEEDFTMGGKRFDDGDGEDAAALRLPSRGAPGAAECVRERAARGGKGDPKPSLELLPKDHCGAFATREVRDMSGVYLGPRPPSPPAVEGTGGGPMRSGTHAPPLKPRGSQPKRTVGERMSFDDAWGEHSPPTSSTCARGERIDDGGGGAWAWGRGRLRGLEGSLTG